MKRRIFGLLIVGALLSGAGVFAQPPLAPVIQDFRSPIVADDDSPTTPDLYVFPDALSLINRAVDPDNTVPPSGILWSYTTDATYELNATPPINLANPNHDPNNPGNHALGVTERDDPGQLDHDPRTLTLRNRRLSPRIGAPTAVASGVGIQPDHTRVITLIASDGTAWSTTSFLAYSSKGGADRFMPLDETSPMIVPSATGPSAWTSVNVFGASLSSDAVNGVCIATGLTELGFGVWTSPFGALPLVKENVYRIRINVESTELLPISSTPLWDFAIDNVRLAEDGNLAFGSQNKYSLDWINWDNHGGANSVGAAEMGRNSFDIWWTPLPVAADDWNHPDTGEFAPANDLHNDGRFAFRVIDVNGTTDGNNDAGTLCLKSYQIDRFDINDFAAVETLYDVQNPVAEFANNDPGFQSEGSNMTVRSIFFGSTNISNSGGATIFPVGNGWDSIEVIEVNPGDDKVNFSEPSTLTDNWPIEWKSNELLRITAGVSAPDATGESNPPDAIRILMDSPTSEIGMDSLVSAGISSLGMPKMSSVTNYTAFYHTQSRTNAAIPQFRTLRPRLSLLCTNSIYSGGLLTNHGGITLKSLKVERLQAVE